MDETHDSGLDADRLDQIVADYTAEADALGEGAIGLATLRNRYLTDFPDLAPALSRHFENDDVFRRTFRGGPVLPSPTSFGDYELLEEIGRGGMGIVYKARQPGLDRTVAVKTILAGRWATEQDIRRFRQEARLAAKLRHAGIVTIYEVGAHDGLLFFSMEHIEGKNLAELSVEGQMTTPQAAECLRQIAEAVHYSHQQGVLHRDLKPSNVLIDSSGRPVVTDFGLAKLVKRDSVYTEPGTILGTLSHMSPEQAEGRDADVDEHSDVYSLGAILYEILTGKPPFRGQTRLETITQVLNVPPLPPRTMNPRVPPELDAICLKCLEKDPAKRYGSADELAQDLQRFLDGEPIEAQPLSFWRLRRYSAVARLEANIATLGLATGLLAALLIGLGPHFGFLGLAPDRPELNAMAAVAILMAIWWLTEAIPSAVTAFMPLILLPALDIVPLADVSKLYMHDVILITLGGFLISIALEESGLIRRLGLKVVSLVGDNPRRIVLGFMIATGAVSMWVSNVAATIIMLPVALSVLSEIEETAAPSASRQSLATAVILGIAYAATIGGMATPVGTLATQNFLPTYGESVNVTFLGWMAVGMPFAIFVGLVSWILLSRTLFRLGTESQLGGKEEVVRRLRKLGPVTVAEQRMLTIVLVTVVLWILSEPVPGWGWAPSLGLAGREGNAMVAMTMAVVCFILSSGRPPRQRLLEWAWTTRLPWGVLFLFGGGLALAEGIKSSGLDSYLADTMASLLGVVPWSLGQAVGTTTFVAGLTQMMSNFATTEMTSPMLLQVADQLALDPQLLLVSGILAAFCGFLLPASTPPNAVIYGSGKVAVRDMVKAGFWLTMAGVIAAVTSAYLLVA